MPGNRVIQYGDVQISPTSGYRKIPFADSNSVLPCITPEQGLPYPVYCLFAMPSSFTSYPCLLHGQKVFLCLNQDLLMDVLVSPSKTRTRFSVDEQELSRALSLIYGTSWPWYSINRCSLPWTLFNYWHFARETRLKVQYNFLCDGSASNGLELGC